MEKEIKIQGPIADDAKNFEGILVAVNAATCEAMLPKSVQERSRDVESGDATGIESQADLDRWYAGTIENTRVVCSIASSFNASTLAVNPLINAWNNYVAFLTSLPGTIEFPNTPPNHQKVQVIRQKEVEIRNCFQYGDNTVYNNFVRELSSFERLGVELENARTRFENSPSATNNLASIEAAMQALLNQNRHLSQFSLVSSPRTTQIFQRHAQLVARFQKVYFTDEIDRLRQEYITYNVTVPARNQFVNSVAGSSYSFAELNFGDYSYAILNGRMIAGLEAINTTLGYRVVVTSGFRNPRKQVTTIGGSAGSQHCYGTAVDLRTSHNQAIWTRVARAACQANANWVEPQAMSTLDHVHADWRGTDVGSSFCNSQAADATNDHLVQTEVAGTFSN